MLDDVSVIKDEQDFQRLVAQSDYMVFACVVMEPGPEAERSQAVIQRLVTEYRDRVVTVQGDARLNQAIAQRYGFSHCAAALFFSHGMLNGVFQIRGDRVEYRSFPR